MVQNTNCITHSMYSKNTFECLNVWGKSPVGNMFWPGIIVGVISAIGSFSIDMAMIKGFQKYLEIFIFVYENDDN